ncbi:hypothetical protein Btru_042941 [Bulinus truncatus]|nr:hypothetical protein Btru_042941 [Bulinus truncatus]
MAYGGYLADLNSKAELEFLRKFLREQGKQFSIVFVGGAYNSHEALFTKTTSGVTRRKSRLGQKDDVRGNEKCISLNRNPNFELKEERCPFTSRKIRFGFICEVPD